MAKPVLYEVVKEFVFNQDDLDFTIKARIVYNIEQNFPYRWEVSHFYCPTKGAGLYIPSKDSAASEGEVLALMGMYVAGFTSIGVEPNQYY